MMTQSILVIDDDPHIREVVEYALAKAGFKAILAGDGRAGIEAFESSKPDLIVLDIEMPEINGTEVCKHIRTKSRVPIIFLTCRDEELERVLGLELGGDDYITKPFSTRELVARIKAVLRRVSDQVQSYVAAALPAVMERGNLKINIDAHKAYWKDIEIELSATEFQILLTLMSYPGKVYSRYELMERVEVNSDRAIDSHVKRIRRKFEAVGASPVETVHGVGYRIAIER